MPDRRNHSAALGAQFSDSHPNRSDRHHDGSRLCINPRGIPPPRRLAYSPKNSGSALELDSRNERNQLGPFCKSMAPSWCKIDVEIGPCQSKKIAVIRCLARLALSLRPLSGLAEDEEPRGARREARGRRRLGPGPMATPLILKRANASRSSGQWRDDDSPRAGFAHRLKDTSDRSVDVAIDLRSEVAADRVDNDQLHVAQSRKSSGRAIFSHCSARYVSTAFAWEFVALSANSLRRNPRLRHSIGSLGMADT